MCIKNNEIHNSKKFQVINISIFLYHLSLYLSKTYKELRILFSSFSIEYNKWLSKFICVTVYIQKFKMPNCENVIV